VYNTRNYLNCLIRQILTKTDIIKSDKNKWRYQTAYNLKIVNNKPAGGPTVGGIPDGGMPVGGIPTGGILGGPTGILPTGGLPGI